MTSPVQPVHVIGAGLAGSECAWQLARRGVPVVLHEMRPVRGTPAHKTDAFAELVCSNSLRSDDPHHAAGLLKREMEELDSLIIAMARQASVPAGSALALDRDRFAALVTETLSAHPLVSVRREEVTALPSAAEASEVVIATGPLTSEAMAAALAGLLGGEYLYFYDAIAPIVEAESLDMSKLFWQSRYGKGLGDDYLNAPMDREEYARFYEAVVAAEVVVPHEFEKAVFFEGCLPIEEIARRGVDTLRYGPMKPVGLTAPDGRRPWAVVQLRQENLAKSQFNLVGFQSRMKWGAQEKVLEAHPRARKRPLRALRADPPEHLRQLPHSSGSALPGEDGATGAPGGPDHRRRGLPRIGGDRARRRPLHRPRPAGGPSGKSGRPSPFPPTTALGALARHITEADPRHFQPANINYGLFGELPGRLKKGDRRAAYVSRAQVDLAAWMERAHLGTLCLEL